MQTEHGFSTKDTADTLYFESVKEQGTLQEGDVTLEFVVPQAEYMFGCAATATGMLLGYYDLYGYTVEDKTYDLSNLIEGTISVNSRGSDGGSIYDMSDPSLLAKFIASVEYQKRFVDTSPEDELPYTFIDGDAAKGLNVSEWNCLADYLGTGQYWRFNEDLSTIVYDGTLNEIGSTDQTLTIDEISIPIKFIDLKCGLSLYTESRGIQLDDTLTCSYDISDMKFEDIVDEIDAGRGVLISMQSSVGGHMVLAYGYNISTGEIIFDDTYQTNCRMKFDGEYLYDDASYSISGMTTIAFDESSLEIIPEVELDPAEWLSDYQQALEIANKNNVPILLYYGDRSTCGFCKALEDEVFASNEFIKYGTTGSVVLLKNASVPNVSYSGTPACFILDSEGNIIAQQSGYGTGWMNWFTENVTLTETLQTIDLLAANAIIATEKNAVASSPEISSGSRIYLSFEISNAGTASSGKKTVAEIYVDDTLVKTVDVPEVEASGTYKVADVDLGILDAGAHSWYVVVDKTSLLEETSEDNNRYSGNFNVLSVEPDGDITSEVIIENTTSSNLSVLTSAGKLIASSGAVINTISVDRGTVCAYGNAAVTNMKAVNSAQINIYSGASVSGLAVDSGSQLLVENGAVIHHLNVGSANAKAALYGTVNQAVVNTAVFAGNGAVLTDLQINSNGSLNNSDDLSNDIVLSGAVVSSGGAISLGTGNGNGIFRGENLTVLSGGVVNIDGACDLAGTIKLAGGLNITNSASTANAALEIDLTPRTSLPDDYMFKYAGQGGFEQISITVSADQTLGLYSLVSGIDLNGCSVSLYCGSDLIGSFTSSGNADWNQSSYSVSFANSALQLEIGDSATSSGSLISSGGFVSSSVIITSNTQDALVELYTNGGIVSQGQTFSELNIEAGGIDSMVVQSGAIVNDINIFNGGNVILTSGCGASSTIIHSGGGLHVYSGAVASDTTVKQSGGLGVGDGAAASGTVIDYAGEVTVWGGGRVVDNQILEWGAILLKSGAAADQTVVYGNGALHVYSGAVANSTTVKQYGGFGVGDGAVAFDTFVDFAGETRVWGGGMVIDNTIAEHGAIILMDGAVASETTIRRNGALHIYAGAQAFDVNVANGAGLGVGGNGTLVDASVDASASMTIYDGARIGGTIRINGSLYTSGNVDATGADIHFVLADRTERQGAVIDDIGKLSSVSSYTIDSVSSLACGSYHLADGAWGFDDTINLDFDGVDSAVLAVGESVSFEGKTFSLKRNAFRLRLNIAQA